ncbi:MAG: hypothetical protein J3R72DRAFT_529858 [Linnemannia gamsii]|nr:MAG: hypothetical protein J3R72DRAFT_529858 [Linnemannia gamsii]
MFERLKFKKKTDPAPSSAHQQQQQSENNNNNNNTSTAAFESTSSPPPLIPSASSSSTTSPPVSYNNTNYIHSYAGPPASVSNVAPLPASSSGSSMANVHRSPSDSSTHNLHLKASYTSINNHYNPYSTTTTTTTNHMMAHDNNGNNNNNNNNYKVPLDSNDANVKVPVSDSSARPASSHTYSNTSNNSNGSNYTNTSNGSNGLNRNASVGRDSDWRTGNNNNNNHAQHTQAPRTIAATKPTVGAFATATVNSIGDFAATTSNNHAHYTTNHNTTVGNNGVGQQGGAAPVSTTSSASPSRSSSTSNRGGAGVSTGGSFTPQSGTPPMTPRLGPGVADASFSPGHEPVHATNDASARDRYSHPSAGPHYGHLTTPALHVQPQSSSSSSAYANHNNTSSPPFGLDESAASAFVSSPVTYQPPAFQTFFTQEGAQQAAGVVATGAGATDNGIHSSTADSLHRAKSIVNAGRETLAQQLEYQNRQMEQFRENMDGLYLDPNGSQTSTPHPSNNSGSPYLNGAGSQPSLNANHPPLASAVAIAASLAGATGHSDGPRLHEDTPLTVTSDHQQPRPRDRTISEGESEHGSRQDFANNTGLTATSLGGSSLFSPPPRTNTSLATSNLVTHDIRQTSQRSHIEDGPGPVVLIAIGKTGQGKSSLLNKIMGTSELKASASVRAVTKGIAERSGWGRFEDSRRVLVTVADTPGLADTEGDDEKNIPILQEYIKSVGTRLGINAFLLVFKIDSGVEMIITILTALNEIMKDFPNFWDNVVLVFTGCDYRRNVMPTKQLYHGEIQQQLEKHFMQDLRRPGPASNRDRDDEDSSSQSGAPGESGTGATTNVDEEGPIPQIPMVFLSCAEAPCGFSLGERCDCKARTTFLNAGIKRLWYKVREKKRWVLDVNEDDDLNGHS